MKKNFKTIISVVLTVALIACLGVSAFADLELSPELSSTALTLDDGSKADGFSRFDISKGNPNPEEPRDTSLPFSDWEGWDDFDSIEDFVDFFGFDDIDFNEILSQIEELIAQIKDSDKVKEIKALYDKYVEAYENAKKAMDEFYKAGDALNEAIDKALSSEDIADSDKSTESGIWDKYGMTEDEFDDLFEEFLKWRDSNSSPSNT